MIINNKYIKILIKSFLIVVVSSLLGFLLLMFSYLIPSSYMEENVRESAILLSEEGMYPNMFAWCNSRLDNSTDSIMLLQAADGSDASTIDKTLLVYRDVINGDAQFYCLIDKYINNIKPEAKTTYARYWHGYLIFLKPLLCIFSYKDIRTINAIFQLLLDILIIYLMYKNKLKKYIVPYIISLLMIMPICIACSLQFSSCFYIFSISTVLLLIFNMNNKQQLFWLVFLLSGIMTSYFDFLTYPIATIGVPLCFYMILEKKDNKNSIYEILLFIVLWGIGYGLMWFNKWALGSLLTNENIIIDGINSFLFRTSSEYHDISNEATPLKVLYKNIMKFINTPFTVFVILLVAYKIIKTIREKLTVNIRKILPFLLIILLPILWQICVPNHSIEHAYFVCRGYIVCVLGVLFMLESIFNEEREKI